MQQAIVLLAAGFEELEAVVCIDVLRRSGIHVTLAGLGSGPITGAHGVSMNVDTALSAQRGADFDLVVLPGGMPGAQNLMESAQVLRLVREAAAAGRWVAAICAAPMVLAAAGVLNQRRFTCYPGFEDRCPEGAPQSAAVVVDGRIITGKGPGAALPFALELVRQLVGSAAADMLAAQMLVESVQPR